MEASVGAGAVSPAPPPGGVAGRCGAVGRRRRPAARRGGQDAASRIGWDQRPSGRIAPARSIDVVSRAGAYHRRVARQAPIRTIAGSTPNTSRIRVAVSTSAGGPSATIRPASSRTSRGKKCARQAQVVEDRQDRRAVALVEVDEQLHRPDLVAQVEVDRRLVEDEHRRRLGDGQREQDELALAERQLAGVAPEQVPDADALDRRRDGRPVRRPRAAERMLVRQPAERDDLLDPRRERQRAPAAGTTASRRATSSRSSASTGSPSSRRVPGGRPHQSGRRPRRSVDLPAPFGPISATRSPGRDREVDPVEDVATAVG